MAGILSGIWTWIYEVSKVWFPSPQKRETRDENGAGREARRKLGEECRESKERNKEMGKLFRELEEILEADERQNNQHDTDEKLDKLVHAKKTQKLREKLDAKPKVNSNLA